MPRARKQSSVFNAGTVINVASIPLLSGLVVLIGWYFLTNDTLRRHDDAIRSIQTQAKLTAEDEHKDREASRKVFLDNQTKTTEVLSKLETRLSVQETKQEFANQTLTKIADEIAKLSVIRR